MLYLLTRTGLARDWGTGLAITASLLGSGSSLQVHHIFPKALLYKAGYVQSEVNAIANFCFLTQTTNLQISDEKPEVYFADIEQKYPGALASQWIPLDPELWKIENYPAFLQARRELLAHAANTLLDDLRHGTVPAPALVTPPTSMPDTPPAQVPQAAPPVLDPEEAELYALIQWVDDRKFPWPDAPFELPNTDPTATPITADLAWPGGLQTGLSQPVALVRDDPSISQVFQSAGYRVFSDTAALKQYLTGLVSTGDA